ncbi:hypothetical protein [Sphingopyxis sp.]|uniref:hypothetical protein n=1 Tax=Sphingopyxis sp. TaxID=1908224 RepID=UPI0035AFF957
MSRIAAIEWDDTWREGQGLFLAGWSTEGDDVGSHYHSPRTLMVGPPGGQLLPFGKLRILRIVSVVNGCYVVDMKEQKSGRFEMVTPPGWIEKIDDWRRKQPDIPPRAEAIRRLVEKGLASE